MGVAQSRCMMESSPKGESSRSIEKLPWSCTIPSAAVSKGGASWRWMKTRLHQQAAAPSALMKIMKRCLSRRRTVAHSPLMNPGVLGEQNQRRRRKNRDRHQLFSSTKKIKGRRRIAAATVTKKAKIEKVAVIVRSLPSRGKTKEKNVVETETKKKEDRNRVGLKISQRSESAINPQMTTRRTRNARARRTRSGDRGPEIVGREDRDPSPRKRKTDHVPSPRRGKIDHGLDQRKKRIDPSLNPENEKRSARALPVMPRKDRILYP
mmetsp:Transcript_53364/g.83089  ORF Transcript_53364/g.83089 Transcript_53364/m.83089 type:complete len:265 (-) Transcript_53364:214-1008(-)